LRKRKDRINTTDFIVSQTGASALITQRARQQLQTTLANGPDDGSRKILAISYFEMQCDHLSFCESPGERFGG
jgi:hypothetical protein